MTYPYSGYDYPSPSNPVTYNQPMYKTINQSKPGVVGSAVIAGTVGAGIGAVVGATKNPYISANGEATDIFAKQVYENIIDKAEYAVKNKYKQTNEVLKQIDGINTPEKLKELFDKNELVAKEICADMNLSPKEYLETVCADNLAANKRVIKDRIKVGEQSKFLSVKNQIQSCWDKQNKKLVKPDRMAEDTFKTIKKSMNGLKLKTTGKIAIIGAGIGAGTGILLKVIHNLTQRSKTQVM